MPLSTRPYRDKAVLPYLWGLLPEDPAARRHVAADADISPNNPFALLGVIGLDCPGAVQFVPQGSDACRDERLVAVSGAEIARRLATSASSSNLTRTRSGSSCSQVRSTRDYCSLGDTQ